MQKEVNNDSLAPAIRLLHRRWSVPVLANLHRSGPLRFTELARILPRASRDTLAETLNDLQGSGVIAHAPFEPAYALTEGGALLGAAAVEAANAVRNAEIARVALKKWPMLVLVAIGRGAARFNEIKSLLPGITSGALAPTLKDLESAGLVERSVSDGYPPAVLYRLTATGEELLPPMDALVRTATKAT